MKKRLPSTWIETTLGSVAHLVNGRAFRPNEWSNSTDGVRIIRIQNLRDPSAPYNYFDGLVEERHEVGNGDLLFAWSGTPGTSFGAHIWNRGRAVLNQHIFKVLFRESLFNTRFLLLAINSELPHLIPLAKGGAGLKHLNKSTVEDIRLPLPPREEQDRIMAAFDATAGRVNTVIRELQDLEGRTHPLVSSILAEATSQQFLQGPERRRSTDFPTDGLQPGWGSFRIADIGEVTLGRQRSPQHHTGPNMRPYLRVANVLEDRIDVSDVMEMNFTPAEFERFQLRPGDILLNEGQSLDLVGRPAMFRGELEDVCFTNTLIRFRAGPHILPDYALLIFRHYLRSGRFRHIAKITTNLAHLGAKRFSNLKVVLPPIETQTTIVETARRLLMAVEKAKTQIQRLRAEAKRLVDQITSAALRGKLVGQKSNEPQPVVIPIGPLRRASRKVAVERDYQDTPVTRMEDESMKAIIPVADALRAVSGPLDAQRLFASAGYPEDASVAQTEQFFIDLRDSIRAGAIVRERQGDEELFQLSAGAGQ